MNMNRMSRRKVLSFAAGAATLPAMPSIARADKYPSRSVLLLLGYAPGGPTDICARLMSQWLSQRLGQQFVVENRDGAGSNIATEAVVRADPDGYTLLLATSSNAINATLYPHLNFNYMTGMVPVCGIMQARLRCSRSIPACRSRAPPNSSPMPRRIRASSMSAPPATAVRRTCSPNCSCT
ncbi:MAG: Bug family tripartite tricarboxylate transporter substrate binding protein [Xanthobacteraceae bacterium]